MSQRLKIKAHRGTTLEEAYSPPLKKGGQGGFHFMLSYDANLKLNARLLRSKMTDSEHKLWSRLRRKQMSGKNPPRPPFFKGGDLESRHFTPLITRKSKMKGSASIEVAVVMLWFLFFSFWFFYFYQLTNLREQEMVFSQNILRLHVDQVKQDLREGSNALQIPCLEDANYDADLPVTLFRTPNQEKICVL